MTDKTNLQKVSIFAGATPELLIWIIALVVLYVMNPDGEAISFCFFKWIGITFCPGCGIGHAMHEVLHGNFVASLQYHPLGIMAVMVLIHRIGKLLFSISYKFLSHASS